MNKLEIYNFTYKIIKPQEILKLKCKSPETLIEYLIYEPYTKNQNIKMSPLYC